MVGTKKIQRFKKNLEVSVPLKNLSNFSRTFGPLINSEIDLILTWSRNCVLTDILTQAANPNANPAVPAINAPTNATIQIKETKLYVLVVNVSTESDKKLLEQLKLGFK